MRPELRDQLGRGLPRAEQRLDDVARREVEQREDPEREHEQQQDERRQPAEQKEDVEAARSAQNPAASPARRGPAVEWRTPSRSQLIWNEPMW